MSAFANRALSGFRLFLSVSLFLSAFSGAASAQAGASTAAAARTSYLSETGSIPAAPEIAVEEFVNYRRHEIGLPKAGEAVNMDVRWGNNLASIDTREAVLQVGFSTALANDRQQLRPLNLALVIDKSGSMADADKMSRVRESLVELISHLRESDRISIVVFDTEARVLVPSCNPYDREGIKRLIRQIEPGGGTNIHGGLILGYEEAEKYYQPNATNRVILLTDGIANYGVTDPVQIACDSLQYNRRGIDLSTIGVGRDLNEDLLRQLARSGRGLFHFVAEAQDIRKVFVDEVQSLVSPVARDPNLTIEYDSGLQLAQLYGYEPQLKRNGVMLRLDNMNNGLTQVVMLRFRIAPWPAENARLPVRVRLSYYDLEQKRQVYKEEQAFITVSSHCRPDELLRDNEVGKNYSIALLAQAIHDMAAAAQGGRYREAESLLAGAIAQTYRRYPHLEDEDIRRTLGIAEKYDAVLKRYNQDCDKEDR